MTVVVAGYEIEPQESMLRLRVAYPDLCDPSGDLPLPTQKEIEEDERRSLNEQLAKPNKAFVLADSLLSRDHVGGRMPVADSAEKISDISIEIAVPNFDPSGFPTGRVSSRVTCSCGVSYAGSVQMWQLTLDRFRREMKELRYTWIRSNVWSQPGHYAICENGAPEDISTIREERVAFDDSISFASIDLPPVEADFVAKVFGNCFDKALMDHFPKEAQIQRVSKVNISIDFVLLVYCQKNKVPRIYRFGWEVDRNTWPSGFKSFCIKVNPHELVVLGHESWKSDFDTARNSAISEGVSIEPKVLMQLAASMKAHANENYVGGEIRIGRLNSMRFETSK